MSWKSVQGVTDLFPAPETLLWLVPQVLHSALRAQQLDLNVLTIEPFQNLRNSKAGAKVKTGSPVSCMSSARFKAAWYYILLS